MQHYYDHQVYHLKSSRAEDFSSHDCLEVSLWLNCCTSQLSSGIRAAQFKTLQSHFFSTFFCDQNFVLLLLGFSLFFFFFYQKVMVLNLSWFLTNNLYSFSLSLCHSFVVFLFSFYYFDLPFCIFFFRQFVYICRMIDRDCYDFNPQFICFWVVGYVSAYEIACHQLVGEAKTQPLTSGDVWFVINHRCSSSVRKKSKLAQKTKHKSLQKLLNLQQILYNRKKPKPINNRS